MSKLLYLLLIAATTAQARIGETPAECVARYGEPLATDKVNMTLGFGRAGLLITATFRDGLCVCIAYKKPAGELGIPGDLSEAEMATLRDANGSGRLWVKPKTFSLGDEWETEDGKLFASKAAMSHIFIIATADELQKREAEKAAKERAKLEGL